ncbi:MAG: cytochrome, partial [Pseudonocardiales bacterium]|nr:cytochrome [Pseudonocardiales bacterium]
MTETDRKQKTFQFNRHSPTFRDEFESVATEMQGRCPVAWSDTYGGHWVAVSHEAIFDIARESDVLSNDHDVTGTKRGYKGISIPESASNYRGGFLEMDPPEQREYRQTLNAYLSPAAVERWKPFVAELTRACLDEVIESGRIDFVDDLANIVPAVLTLAMMGLPLKDWVVYCEPAHASVYTPPDSPDFPRVMQGAMNMNQQLAEAIVEIRDSPRPGMINALINSTINDETPPDHELT